MAFTTKTIESDNFTRGNTTASTNVATGWGTSSNGEAWSSTVQDGSLSNFSIASNQGKAVGTASSDLYLSLGSNTYANVDLRGRVSTSSTVTGDAQGYFARLQKSPLNTYGIYINGGTILDITKISNGTGSILSTATISYSANTEYWLRFRCIGTHLYAKFWAASGGEPSTWNISITDSSFSSGLIGIYNGPSGSGDTTVWDSFTVTDGSQTGYSTIRIPVSTLKTPSTGIRIVVSTQNTKSTGIRTVVSTKNTQSTGIRTIVSTPRTQSTGVRTVVSTQNTKSTGIRILVATPVYATDVSAVSETYITTDQLAGSDAVSIGEISSQGGQPFATDSMTVAESLLISSQENSSDSATAFEALSTVDQFTFVETNVNSEAFLSTQSSSFADAPPSLSEAVSFVVTEIPVDALSVSETITLLWSDVFTDISTGSDSLALVLNPIPQDGVFPGEAFFSQVSLAFSEAVSSSESFLLSSQPFLLDVGTPGESVTFISQEYSIESAIGSENLLLAANTSTSDSSIPGENAPTFLFQLSVIETGVSGEILLVIEQKSVEDDCTPGETPPVFSSQISFIESVTGSENILSFERVSFLESVGGSENSTVTGQGSGTDSTSIAENSSFVSQENVQEITSLAEVFLVTQQIALVESNPSPSENFSFLFSENILENNFSTENTFSFGQIVFSDGTSSSDSTFLLYNQILAETLSVGEVSSEIEQWSQQESVSVSEVVLYLESYSIQESTPVSENIPAFAVQIVLVESIVVSEITTVLEQDAFQDAIVSSDVNISLESEFLSDPSVITEISSFSSILAVPIESVSPNEIFQTQTFFFPVEIVFAGETLFFQESIGVIESGNTSETVSTACNNAFSDSSNAQDTFSLFSILSVLEILTIGEASQTVSVSSFIENINTTDVFSLTLSENILESVSFSEALQILFSLSGLIDSTSAFDINVNQIVGIFIDGMSGGDTFEIDTTLSLLHGVSPGEEIDIQEIDTSDLFADYSFVSEQVSSQIALFFVESSPLGEGQFALPVPVIGDIVLPFDTAAFLVEYAVTDQNIPDESVSILDIVTLNLSFVDTLSSFEIVLIETLESFADAQSSQEQAFLDENVVCIDGNSESESFALQALSLFLERSTISEAVLLYPYLAQEDDLVETDLSSLVVAIQSGDTSPVFEISISLEIDTFAFDFIDTLLPGEYFSEELLFTSSDTSSFSEQTISTVNTFFVEARIQSENVFFFENNFIQEIVFSTELLQIGLIPFISADTSIVFETNSSNSLFLSVEGGNASEQISQTVSQIFGDNSSLSDFYQTMEILSQSDDSVICVDGVAFTKSIMLFDQILNSEQVLLSISDFSSDQNTSFDALLLQTRVLETGFSFVNEQEFFGLTHFEKENSFVFESALLLNASSQQESVTSTDAYQLAAQTFLAESVPYTEHLLLLDELAYRDLVPAGETFYWFGPSTRRIPFSTRGPQTISGVTRGNRTQTGKTRGSQITTVTDRGGNAPPLDIRENEIYYNL